MSIKIHPAFLGDSIWIFLDIDFKIPINNNLRSSCLNEMKHKEHGAH